VKEPRTVAEAGQTNGVTRGTGVGQSPSPRSQQARRRKRALKITKKSKIKIVYSARQQCALDSHNYDKIKKYKLDNKNIKTQLKAHRD